ncbi:MAG: alpha/beta hydrolase [Candidatus Helarchaeota archaeon]|nr:alpha/beta hydrolase [Candidatus Helarchaeota archaeon]
MLSKKKLVLLCLPFLLFLGSLTAQLVLFFNITSRVESITFPSVLSESPSVVAITSGNIFYPRDYIPGQKYPVVIIAHGFEVTKTTDLRLATELAKRGIFALPIDLSGHGQTTGGGLQLGPYFWKNAIGALDYVYSRPDLFNLSAVGMCGHSLGGWTTFLAMGYEAAGLNRINACVSWAGVFNTSRLLDASLAGDVNFEYIFRNLKVDPYLFDNFCHQSDLNPVNYFNGSLGTPPPPDAFGPRILVIHGTADETVSYDNLLDANKTLGTNANYYTLPQVDHTLLDDRVIYQTILHFEHHFFGIDPAVNDLSIASFTYLSYYLLFVSTLLGLFFSILSLVFIFWYKNTFKRETPAIPQPRGFKFVLLASLPYVGLLFAMYGLQELLYNLYLSLLIGSTFFFAYTLGLMWYLKRGTIQKTTVWEAVRSNFHGGSVSLGTHLGLFAILGYLALSYGFGLLVFSPLSLEYLVLALLGLCPFVLSQEIFLRKLIQDNIPLRNRWLKRILMGFYTLGLMILFFFLLGFMFLAVIAMIVAFAVGTLTGIFIYEKYPSLGATTVFTTILMSVFAANCYFFFI